MSLNFPPGLAISPSQAPWEKTRNMETEDSGGVAETSDLQIEQDISNFGIAGRIWEAAYLLRSYLRLSQTNHGPSEVEFDPPCSLLDSRPSKVVVELGSGTGYVGLEVARSLDAKDTVILTDLEEVCPNLERSSSAASQKSKARVLVRPLAWGSIQDGERLKSKDLREFSITHVVCSDLVYFPPLLPPLLRTLLQLTAAPSVGGETGQTLVEIIISYKVRCLEFEAPFWSAFGAYFTFEPVYVRRKRNRAVERDEESWIRFGSAMSKWDDGMDGDGRYFVFIAKRRPESHEWRIPGSDEELMNGRGDSTFETLLMLDMDI